MNGPTQNLQRAAWNACVDAMLATTAEFLVRYCPGCGSACSVESKNHDCCLAGAAHFCGERHEAVGHVAVEGKLCTQPHEPRAALHVADLEPGLAHLDAQRARLIGARNDRPIVAAEYNDGPTAQPRVKGHLAADVEAIAVQQGNHGALTPVAGA